MKDRKQIRNVTKKCTQDLNQFLKLDCEMTRPAFGYPEIQFEEMYASNKGWYQDATTVPE